MKMVTKGNRGQRSLAVSGAALLELLVRRSEGDDAECCEGCPSSARSSSSSHDGVTFTAPDLECAVLSPTEQDYHDRDAWEEHTVGPARAQQTLMIHEGPTSGIKPSSDITRENKPPLPHNKVSPGPICPATEWLDDVGIKASGWGESESAATTTEEHRLPDVSNTCSSLSLSLSLTHTHSRRVKLYLRRAGFFRCDG